MIKHLSFSLLFTLVTWLIIFFFPIPLHDVSEPVYSPYYEEISEIEKKDSLSSSEYEELKELIKKNNEWGAERTKAWLEGKSVENKNDSLPEINNISEFISIKSSKLSYIYMMVWALLSYLYLVHKNAKAALFLLSFPVVFFIAGFIPISALLFILLGTLLSLMTIKFINPMIKR